MLYHLGLEISLEELEALYNGSKTFLDYFTAAKEEAKAESKEAEEAKAEEAEITVEEWDMSKVIT